MRQVVEVLPVGSIECTKCQVGKSAIDPLEITETGDKFRSSTNRAFPGEPDKPGGAGANSFDGLGAETCLFDVNARC